MKKYITVILLLTASICAAQTTQDRAGYYSDGRPGKKFVDTVYLLSNLPLTYFNGFGNFVSLSDTVRSLFSVTGAGLAYNNATGVFTHTPGVDSIWRTAGQDSIKFSIGGRLRSIKDSSGGGGGGTPAGSTNYIQYNVAGAFAADTTAKHNPTGFQIISGAKIYVATLFKGNISAVANNDTLVGLEVNPKFTLGAFTGAKQIGMRVQGIEFGGGKDIKEGNIAIGKSNLQSVSSGVSNVGIGFDVLTAVTSGSNNTGLGYRALSTASTTSNNVAIGFDALRLGSPVSSVAIGTNVLKTGNGTSNVMIGFNAATSASYNASYNVGLGQSVFASNTTGDQSIAIGLEALLSNTTGRYNVAIGSQALTSNGTTSNNVAVGYQSLLSNTGFSNTAIGYHSLYSNSTGKNNIAIGDSAGRNNTTASNQVFISSVPKTGASYTTDTTNSIFYAVQSTTVESQRTKLGGGGTVGVNQYGTSTLAVGGSFGTAYTATATSLTADITHNVIDVTATGQTITLPTAAGITGREYTIKLTASGTGTVATTSSQTIDGSTTYSLSAQYKYVRVKSTGSNWIIIGNN